MHHTTSSAPVRTPQLVVLADVHLGDPHNRTEALSSYLASIQPDVLVINGGLIDLSSRHPLPAAHRAVSHGLLRLSATGTRIYYLIGDHDATLRQYPSFSAGNMHLREELVLQLGGRRYWFLNGEGLELLGTPGPGSVDYRRRRTLYRWYRRSWSRWRPGTLLNPGDGTSSVDRQHRFERNARALARGAAFDGVVCGHTGVPALSPADASGVRYANPGSWNRYRTSIEVQDGEWRLHHHEMPAAPPTRLSLERLGQLARRPEARFLQLLGLGLAT